MTIFNRAIRGVAASLVLIAGSAAASPSGGLLEHAFIAFNGPSLPSGIGTELTNAGVVHGIELTTINAVAVTAPRAVLERYATDPRVKAVTSQRKIELHLYSSVAQINARDVDTPETIDASTGLQRPGVDGSGVTVAIIDSGIYAAHTDIAPRMLSGYNFEFSTLVRESQGVLTNAEWDVYADISGVAAFQDEVGHGTHVAGIVGGNGFGSQLTSENNAGVAPGVDFVALKIASAGNGVVEDIGFEANAVAAIDYLVRHRQELGNVRVANNSWGLLPQEAGGLLITDYDPAREVVKAAVDAGIVFVFSAGNDGPDADTIRPVPNGMDEIISVASACKADHGSCPAGEINGFSSRGPQVTIAAPGDQILSAMSPASVLAPLGQALEGDYFGPSPQEEANNRALYIRLSGTSMASPHVAGVVALLLQANPTLTPAQVKQILIETADDMVVDGTELTPGFDNASGYGLVNTRAALARAMTITDEAQASDGEAPARRAGITQAGGALSWALPLLLLGIARRRMSTGRRISLN